MKTHQLWLKQITKLGLLLMMGVSMSACATSTFMWKEEVLLHDDKKIVVERSETYDSSMPHEIGQGAPLAEQVISFTLYGTNQTVFWKSSNRPLPEPENLDLLVLDFLDSVPYIATTPNRPFAFVKWGKPNPPYVFFKYDGKMWQRITLEQFPQLFKINLIPDINAQDKKKIIADNQKYGFLRAQTVAEIIGEPGREKKYYSILRTPIDYGPPRDQGSNSGRMVRTGDGGWIGMDWFEKQPSLEACLKKCAREKVNPQDCPCNTLFKGK